MAVPATIEAAAEADAHTDRGGIDGIARRVGGGRVAIGCRRHDAATETQKSRNNGGGAQ